MIRLANCTVNGDHQFELTDVKMAQKGYCSSGRWPTGNTSSEVGLAEIHRTLLTVSEIAKQENLEVVLYLVDMAILETERCAVSLESKTSD